MWLSVFIVFSLVVFVWIQSFQQRLTFLLNPSEELETAKQESPIAIMGKSFNELRATIFDLFDLAAETKEGSEVRNNLEEKIEGKIAPRLLPISE